MDHEKKYKNALANARQKYNTTENLERKQWLEELFPELTESEDERIRKELLEHCKNQAKPYIQTGNKCPQIQSWIAWLEKQTSKSKWSEEDEDNLNLAIYHIRCDNFSYSPHDIEPIVDWLKSIKQRMEEHQ